ncbi:hypothetical protein CU097_010366 [Rhizopus azygosporus]|uniref:Velvet domain-containing protein n=2 Tax=Rhizopus TaxID=4842 RepID=A0A367KAK8_RHIAZ|nr:hypothetical protein BCV71DRAFT_264787 [Rhizopus microsporus]RCH99159.1 hypothetical protein CU097_010366 [Rhizopus azygosporus]
MNIMRINHLQQNRQLNVPFFHTSSKPQTEYTLTVRQQPKKARLCSFKDKVDRRPLDPPPIVQLHQTGSINFNNYWISSNFFVIATLIDSENYSDIHIVNGHQTTAGSIAQSLHKLRDTDNREGAFFVFSDISIRIEGVFRLKFTLFQIKGSEAERICYVISDKFQVYSPKCFPGMSGSTELTRLFSEQGVRLRIRKEARAACASPMKRRREIQQNQNVGQNLESNDTHKNTKLRRTYQSSNILSPQEGYSGTSSSEQKCTNVMSMQNLLITNSERSVNRASISSTSSSTASYKNNLLHQRILPPPLPTASYAYGFFSTSGAQDTTTCPQPIKHHQQILSTAIYSLHSQSYPEEDN